MKWCWKLSIFSSVFYTPYSSFSLLLFVSFLTLLLIYSDLFNLPNLVEEVVGSIVEGGVSAIVGAASADVDAQITAAGAEIGV